MNRRTQVSFLLAMIAMTCLMQALAISRAAVPALDAVRFVNSAQAIDQLGLLGFLRDQTEPPLFPFSIWVIHSILTAVVGDFRECWALSVQVAAALPLVLLPVPVFLLGKRLVGPRAAMLGTVLVLCLPELIRLGADGISDSTHLLWFCLAMTLLVAHLLPTDRPHAPALPAVLAGSATALALLTRSEAIVLAASFGVVLSARGGRCRKVPWRSAFSYAGGLSAILVPYALLLALAQHEPANVARSVTSEQAVLLETEFESTDGEPLSFAPKDPTTSIRRRGLTAAIAQVADKLPKAFGYLPGIFAVVGFWVLRRRPNTDADFLLQIFCVLMLAAILVHTTREGYLAARHLLPIAVAATACIGAGVQAVADQIRQALTRTAIDRTAAPVLAIAMALVVASICTIHGVRPLHPTRTGHRSAANWLAQNARCGDRVVDTHGWTGLYSGLATVPFTASRSELSHRELRYLVVEDCELAHDSRRSRTILRLLRTAGTHVATFSTPSSTTHPSASVLIYEWNATACQ